MSPSGWLRRPWRCCSPLCPVRDTRQPRLCGPTGKRNGIIVKDITQIQNKLKLCNEPPSEPIGGPSAMARQQALRSRRVACNQPLADSRPGSSENHVSGLCAGIWKSSGPAADQSFAGSIALLSDDLVIRHASEQYQPRLESGVLSRRPFGLRSGSMSIRRLALHGNRPPALDKRLPRPPITTAKTARR